MLKLTKAEVNRFIKTLPEAYQRKDAGLLLRGMEEEIEAIQEGNEVRLKFHPLTYEDIMGRIHVSRLQKESLYERKLIEGNITFMTRLPLSELEELIYNHYNRELAWLTDTREELPLEEKARRIVTSVEESEIKPEIKRGITNFTIDALEIGGIADVYDFIDNPNDIWLQIGYGAEGDFGFDFSRGNDTLDDAEEDTGFDFSKVNDTEDEDGLDIEDGLDVEDEIDVEAVLEENIIKVLDIFFEVLVEFKRRGYKIYTNKDNETYMITVDGINETEGRERVLSYKLVDNITNHYKSKHSL